MVLKHETLFIDKPGFNIEHIEFVPEYINFHVAWDSPDAAATDVIGEFVVSPRTGDVWESNMCKQYAFSELKRLQTEIMKRTGWTLAGELKEREDWAAINKRDRWGLIFSGWGACYSVWAATDLLPFTVCLRETKCGIE
ncbi:hypothetical protein CWS02_05580 [Enterobacter sp. EA-1]|nr:hypothetical protein CWS02_05580 [Enterobacter sp. EA-1]